MKGREGVWYLGYLDTLPKEFQPFFQGRGVTSRIQAVKIVAYERADYYFDNKDQMMRAIQSTEFSLKSDDYQLETVYIGEKYWQFHPSERGEKIREIFDHGFKKLYCSGALLQLYKKWGLQGEFPAGIIMCDGEK